VKKLLIFLVFLINHQFAFSQTQKDYNFAYEEMRAMLEKKNKISFKQAVFHTENAFLEGHLKQEWFDEEILWYKKLAIAYHQNDRLNYSEKDSIKVGRWASVFKLITDTIPIQLDNEIVNHLPFGYDFEDFFGDTDWTKGFVTKLLATKKGNCHSLPYLYKILCDELGAEAHLALAPNHLYIKHHSKKTGWYNTELTSATFPIDAWLMVSGYISLEAIQNAVYMDTIGTHRAVALCVVDLGQGYAKKHPDNDGTFILQCCELALKHFPTCINAMLLKAETLFAQHKKLVQAKGKDDPETKAKFAEMNKIYKQIYQSGYRQMPKQMYANWLLDLKENKDKYINKKVAVFKK
jgi:hypothetical protein